VVSVIDYTTFDDMEWFSYAQSNMFNFLFFAAINYTEAGVLDGVWNARVPGPRLELENIRPAS
jgi:hypothetical protein